MKLTQAERILQMLREAGLEGVTNYQLNAEVCFRYGARIYELKRMGYDIRAQHGKGSLWSFFLVGEPLCTTEHKTLGSEKAHFSLESATATIEEKTA